MVNDTVTVLGDANGTRSAAAMVKVTPVTWPPRAGYPQVPAWSALVLTLMPLEEAGVGPPMDAPVRVTVYAAAAAPADPIAVIMPTLPNDVEVVANVFAAPAEVMPIYPSDK